jgi:hypothetical protein
MQNVSHNRRALNCSFSPQKCLPKPLKRVNLKCISYYFKVLRRPDPDKPTQAHLTPGLPGPWDQVKLLIGDIGLRTTNTKECMAALRHHSVSNP